jgi:uncharacterized OsmC-like protein
MSIIAEAAAPRVYEVRAETTATFGRVLCSARSHHFVVDGPVGNGCPGEALTPAELFLSGVAACGTELMQVIARDEGLPLSQVRLVVRGSVDRSRQAREDLTLLTDAEIEVALTGPSDAQAAFLVAGFQRRCPLYGTLAFATGAVGVTISTHPVAIPLA